jgi:hypothetical protein
MSAITPIEESADLQCLTFRSLQRDGFLSLCCGVETRSKVMPGRCIVDRFPCDDEDRFVKVEDGSHHCGAMRHPAPCIHVFGARSGGVSVRAVQACLESRGRLL